MALDREWVSIVDPDDPHARYLFDVTFLTSAYTCIYGAGCPGTAGVEGDDRGCCRFGAHYVTEEDRAAVEGMVEVLGPEWMQQHRRAVTRGVTATEPDGSRRTRLVNGACIFLNRADWHRGPGCALHQYAVARGEHHMTYKPEVCWIVPLRREITEEVADDGEDMVTTWITSYDRGAWGPGGADFAWWCTTDDDAAYRAPRPVYETMAAELTAMSSPAVYAELRTYLDARRSRRRRPLPLLPRR